MYVEIPVAIEADLTDEAMEEIINDALWHLSELIDRATESAWVIERDGAIEYEYHPEEEG